MVPAIGRVMQLRLAGEDDGAFWENRQLDGRLQGDPSADGEWLNFGGDKSWPAPQSEWRLHLGRAWPPPAGFDSMPAAATECPDGVAMTLTAGPAYGIQLLRRIQLDPAEPTMRITTEYRKLDGPPVRVGVWSITQMCDPQRVYALLPQVASPDEAYTRLLPAEPAHLRYEGRLLSLARHPRELVKIGARARSLLWVGPRAAVLIESEAADGEFPDNGCRTEIYTNPDPLPYVELECLGPLVNLQPGDCTALTAQYSIVPRTQSDPDCEARRLLGI